MKQNLDELVIRNKNEDVSSKIETPIPTIAESVDIQKVPKENPLEVSKKINRTKEEIEEMFKHGSDDLTEEDIKNAWKNNDENLSPEEILKVKKIEKKNGFKRFVGKLGHIAMYGLPFAIRLITPSSEAKAQDIVDNNLDPENLKNKTGMYVEAQTPIEPDDNTYVPTQEELNNAAVEGEHIDREKVINDIHKVIDGELKEKGEVNIEVSNHEVIRVGHYEGGGTFTIYAHEVIDPAEDIIEKNHAMDNMRDSENSKYIVFSVDLDGKDGKVDLVGRTNGGSNELTVDMQASLNSISDVIEKFGPDVDKAKVWEVVEALMQKAGIKDAPINVLDLDPSFERIITAVNEIQGRIDKNLSDVENHLDKVKMGESINGAGMPSLEELAKNIKISWGGDISDEEAMNKAKEMIKSFDFQYKYEEQNLIKEIKYLNHEGKGDEAIKEAVSKFLEVQKTKLTEELKARGLSGDELYQEVTAKMDYQLSSSSYRENVYEAYK